jgi:hypothetical protein
MIMEEDVQPWPQTLLTLVSLGPFISLTALASGGALVTLVAFASLAMAALVILFAGFFACIFIVALLTCVW